MKKRAARGSGERSASPTGLRITGGTWGGRRIETLPGDATRPSMDAHRQSLFNVLGQDLTGERVLDLFAGSGAFAFESLSRGAARAVLVEGAAPALAVIGRNAAALGIEAGRCEVVSADAYELPGPPATQGPFDVVFVAPPYPHFRTERVRLAALVGSLAHRLAEDGVAVVQSDKGDFAGQLPPGLEVTSRRTWGRTEFTFVRRAAGGSAA